MKESSLGAEALNGKEKTGNLEVWIEGRKGTERALSPGKKAGKRGPN